MRYTLFYRFDICEAYYVFATIIGGHDGEAILKRLERMEFKPGLSTASLYLSENAQDICNELFRKYVNKLREEFFKSSGYNLDLYER